MPHAVIQAKKALSCLNGDNLFFSKKSGFLISPVSTKCENFIIRAYQNGEKIVVKLDKTTNPLITDDVKSAVLNFSLYLAKKLNGKTIHHNLVETKKECEVLKRYLLDIEDINKKGFNTLLNSRKIAIEIGIGKGEFLCETAKKNRDTVFVGFEIANDPISKAALRFSRENIDNIKLVHYDARFGLDLFKSNTVQTIYVNFPEPWFKFKKLKHALLNTTTIKKIERILKKGGTFELLTDNLAYAVSISTALELFTKLKCNQERCIETSNKSINTYFERRWKRKRRTIYSVIYKKTDETPDLEPIDLQFPLKIRKDYILKDGLIFKVLDIFENNKNEKIAEITFGESVNPQHAYFGLTDDGELFPLPQTVFLLDQEAKLSMRMANF